MSTYYFTILAVFVFALLAVHTNSVNKNALLNKQRATKGWLFCVAITLICVSGLRYSVGTDFSAYYKILKTSSWLQTWTRIKEVNEPGFSLLAQILKWFTDDGAVFIFITSAFTIGVILFITYKYTDKYLFVSLLIVFVGILDGSFNGIRQYFAAAIICLGHRYILDKKFWKYLLCVLIAFLFHSSAIVMIIPYFILRNKISLKNIAIMIIGSVILLYNYEFIFSFVENLKNDTIDTNSAYASNQVNILRVLANITPAIFCLFIYSTSKLDKEQTFYVNVLILYALLSIIGMNSPYLSRVNIYLSVLLPLAMGKLIVFNNKTEEFAMKAIIIGLFFAFWLYGITNSSALNNFRWVWER